MCGFCGLVNARDAEAAGQRVAAMADMLERRGPDDAGTWASDDGRARLGFRRLSIIDTTPAGHQPMISGDGRAVITFNGEIYNHQELRSELEAAGVVLRSRSDTEVLLEWLRRHGVDGLARLNGMFALAYFEPESRRLLLARDHVGIKPLFYATEPRNGAGVAFSSRYDSLFHTGWLDPDQVRPDVLRLYLELKYIPAPFALHHGAAQVEAGGYVQIDESGVVATGRWWDPPHDQAPDLVGAEAVAAASAALDAAIRRQRVADVPVGVFLSGGVDSPLVAAIARSQSDASLHAFTVGSKGWRGDETDDAARYARLLDVQHVVLDANDDEVRQAVDEVLEAQYEPLGDHSLVPTLLVSKLARRDVTVALSGDGGDELFFGYERPRSLLKQWEGWKYPTGLRRAAVAAGRRGLWPGKAPAEALAHASPGAYYRSVHAPLSADAIQSLAPGLPAVPSSFVLYDFEGPPTFERLAAFSRRIELGGQLQQILKKVDMASMHHSLEVRVPVLDREVIDVAFRIAPATHMDAVRRKAVLFELLGDRVGAGNIPESKRGFAAPIGDWLLGPLAPRVEDTLLGDGLYPSGLFDRDALAALWKDHADPATGGRTWELWTLLSLGWWGERARAIRAEAR